MNLHVIYSGARETHTPLLWDFFLPSFRKYPDGFDSISMHRLSAAGGVWASEEWGNFLVHRTQWMLRLLKHSVGGSKLLFSDVDVQWFKPVGTPVAQFEPSAPFVSMQDKLGSPCMGFFRVTACPWTISAFTDLEETIRTGTEKVDQDILAKLFEARGYTPPLFDADEFWACRGKINDGSLVEEVPKNIRMHHGNWNYLVAEKAKLMTAVRDVVAGYNSAG
jgi:hypothetical protein